MKTSTLFYISVLVFLFTIGILWLMFGGSGNADSANVTTNPDGGTELLPSENSKPSISDPGAPALTAKKEFDFSHAVENFKSIPEISKCTAGILADLNTREVVWAKNANKAVPIASMTKLLTALLVAETAEKDPAKGYDVLVKVTPGAIKVNDGEVWLDHRESFTVEKLLQATLIRSANDCAVLLAEFYGNGKESVFIQKMNDRAKELGMKESRFFVPNGLPGKSAAQDNVSTPEEMLFLCEAFMKYPKLMEISAIERETLPSPQRKVPTELLNTNRYLLRNVAGCTGLKTGFTDRSGFCVAASFERKGRRWVCVVMGLPDQKSRNELVKKLVEAADPVRK